MKSLLLWSGLDRAIDLDDDDDQEEEEESAGQFFILAPSAPRISNLPRLNAVPIDFSTAWRWSRGRSRRSRWAASA